MYSLLIKDRSYPFSVYMSYMMRVKGFTRSEAVELMTLAAVKMGARERPTPPANNTVAEWGRAIDAPQWAVVSVMKIMEQFGKVPFTDREWAFWAYATAEVGGASLNYSGVWLEWLDKAVCYKYYYEKRGVIRHRFEHLISPNLAMKIFLLFKGNQLTSLTIPEIFANIDTSPDTMRLLDARFSSGALFNDSDMQAVVSANVDSAKLKEDIVNTIQCLTSDGVLSHLANGNIMIA